MPPIILISFLGYVHPSAIKETNMVLAEEIHNAATVTPLSMGISTLLNGTLEFAMLIALFFCMSSDIKDL